MNETAAKKDAQQTNREIRSFVLRQGRLTSAQQYALDNYWQQYGIDFSAQSVSFSEIFGNDHEVIFEIGFGNGESLLQQAKNQPAENFIGIEVHAPGVGHLLHHIHDAGLNNLKIIRHDAVEVLKQQIADDSISKLQLFFPDPWHKKRHHKRRIINPEFIALVHKKLKPGGLFHLATDWLHYAEQMLMQLDASEGFINTAGNGHFSANSGERCETKFERRGIRLGHEVRDLIYKKHQEPKIKPQAID